MKKTSLLFLLATALFVGKSFAQQHCYADEMHRNLLKTHPEIAAYEAEMNKQIAEGLKKIDFRTANKTTSDSDQSGNAAFVYDIPVVVHIVHDFGQEYLTDDQIFNDLVGWNQTYNGGDGDTSLVIQPFKKYVGEPNIRIHLATIDPSGNPTKGITRHRSYLSVNGNDQAKIDDWAPTSYVNIWFIHNMSGANADAAAYAYWPSDAAEIPFYDGVIALYNYAANVPSSAKTINHEMGHVFNLYHPWGSTNDPNVACGDDDVDDTPPTKGHAETGCTAASLYDTACATSYFKIYTALDGSDSLANYPDTVNAENIMDYTYCARMFTKGQVVRMHAALNSDIAGRDSLWTPSNLVNTGVIYGNALPAYSFIPRPDLKPIPDFSSVGGSNPGGKIQYFTVAGYPITFVNKSWNDTITKVKWNLPSGTKSVISAGSVTDSINAPTYNSYINATFYQPGWQQFSMTATGNNTGDNTVDFSNTVYVADSVATAGTSIMEEFDPASTGANWPTFNYYNNEFKWAPSNAGMYDNHSMEYLGYDNRINPLLGIYPNTGSPVGDFDDMFSTPVDLTSFTSGGACNLNFFYSGASRSSNSDNINDSMLISYSIDHGVTWTKLLIMKKGALDNKGALSIPYAPVSPSDWAAETVPLPTVSLKKYVLFRFRYFPNNGIDGLYSSGNNFYMDRVNFSQYAAEVSSVQTSALDVVVAPNPTGSNAYVIVKDADNTKATIVVSDIAGRMVYTTSQEINGTEARIEIPQSALTVKGVYMVQTRTGNQTSTQKLVVY